MDKSIIYIATNKINNMKYIGQTTQTLKKRKSQRYNKYFTAALNKYKFSWVKIFVSTLELDIWEKFYIKHYNTLYPNGYNFDEGGQKNRIMSEATKQKISEGNRGKILSEETKKKMSGSKKGENNPFFGCFHTEESKQKISKSNNNKNNPFYGRTHTKESKQKISKIHKGKVLSEETKKKISESNIGKSLSSAVKQKISTSSCKFLYKVTNPSAEVEIIRNLRKYCKANKLDISHMIKVSSGKRKHHKGYKIEKIKE